MAENRMERALLMTVSSSANAEVFGSRRQLPLRLEAIRGGHMHNVRKLLIRQ